MVALKTGCDVSAAGNNVRAGIDECREAVGVLSQGRLKGCVRRKEEGARLGEWFWEEIPRQIRSVRMVEGSLTQFGVVRRAV